MTVSIVDLQRGSRGYDFYKSLPAVTSSEAIAIAAEREAARSEREGAFDRLTRAQAEELLLQAKKPQDTYGRSRTRVQNNLVAKGLSIFRDDQGRATRPNGSMYVGSVDSRGQITWAPFPAPKTCEITDRGRRALAAIVEGGRRRLAGLIGHSRNSAQEGNRDKT